MPSTRRPVNARLTTSVNGFVCPFPSFHPQRMAAKHMSAVRSGHKVIYTQLFALFAGMYAGRKTRRSDWASSKAGIRGVKMRETFAGRMSPVNAIIHPVWRARPVARRLFTIKLPPSGARRRGAQCRASAATAQVNAVGRRPDGSGNAGDGLDGDYASNSVELTEVIGRTRAFAGRDQIGPFLESWG
jgi:hypothetical protein